MEGQDIHATVQNVRLVHPPLLILPKPGAERDLRVWKKDDMAYPTITRTNAINIYIAVTTKCPNISTVFLKNRLSSIVPNETSFSC